MIQKRNFSTLTAAGFATAALALSAITPISSMGAVFFETFDYPSPPTVGTDAANLNGSNFQEGSWSGTLPAGIASPAAPELIDQQQGSIHLDRPTANAFIRGDFARPLPLEGTQINYDFALSRTQGNHNKDIELVGLDAGGNEAFRLVMSADNTAAQNDARRLGYYADGTSTITWDLPGAAEGNNYIAGGTGGAYSPNFGAISVNLTPAGYTVGYTRATSFVSSVIPYREATGDLTAIQFHFLGGGNNGIRSGFFLDNIYAGAKQVPEPSTAAMLIFGVIGLRYSRKLMQKKQG